jgi:AcrR family transcriptional regulator
MSSLPDHLKPAPVGREPLPREVLAHRQRLRILEAATTVFAEQGYPETTVDDIVAAAEIGVGSFYALCSGKEDCLLRVYDQIVAEAKDELAAAVAGSSAWEDRICKGLRRALDLIAEQPHRARIVLIEIQTAGEPALERYNASLAEAARQLSAGRGRADQAQWLPQSLEVIVANCVAWLLHREIFAGEATATPSLFNEMAELALEPYLGEGRAQAFVAAHVVAPGIE